MTGQGDNGFKLEEERFRIGIRKKFFTLIVIRLWHPENLGMPHSWKRSEPDRPLSNLV